MSRFVLWLYRKEGRFNKGTSSDPGIGDAGGLRDQAYENLSFDVTTSYKLVCRVTLQELRYARSRYAPTMRASERHASLPLGHAAVHADASQVGERQMSNAAERGGRLCFFVARSALSLAFQALNGTPQSENQHADEAVGHVARITDYRWGKSFDCQPRTGGLQRTTTSQHQVEGRPDRHSGPQLQVRVPPLLYHSTTSRISCSPVHRHSSYIGYHIAIQK
ncbi:hypothetical protein EVAR_61804_1, partial [Eumeta japonica]